MDESYYVSHGGKIPVKWTAPEVSGSLAYDCHIQGWPNAAPGAACSPCHKFAAPLLTSFAYIRVRAACARSSSAKYTYPLQGSTFACTAAGYQRNVMGRNGPRHVTLH